MTPPSTVVQSEVDGATSEQPDLQVGGRTPALNRERPRAAVRRGRSRFNLDMVLVSDRVVRREIPLRFAELQRESGAPERDSEG